MIFEDDPNISKNQVLRATGVLISFLRFRRSMIDNVLAPEKFDRTMLRHFYSTTRLPKQSVDTVEHFGEHQKHVVFIQDGHFYVFDALDQTGNIKSPEEIYNFIYNLNEYREENSGSISSFPALRRDNWAEIRSKLENLTDRNRENLHLIDSALTIVCLDREPFEPDDLNSRALGFLTGTYTNANADKELKSPNRWFDKSIQLIISKNGDVGLNFEVLYHFY